MIQSAKILSGAAMMLALAAGQANAAAPVVNLTTASAVVADNTKYVTKRPAEADRLFVSDAVEKKIKEVFTDYKELCNKMKKLKCGRTPILLFNECDAVFSKRKDISYSNTAQTENSIQNIILEEMENLEGILIASTNLTDNLDPAFERRFLFKIQFENPSVEAKKAIWAFV